METAKRTSNSIRNSLFGIGSQIIIVLIGFFTRSVFLKYLSEDYLGLNGLFSNVISILSLTELGFGTAAIFSLYKPLAEKDEQKVAALMNLYAKIYHVMFAVVSILGLVLTPFIRYLIKDIPEDIPDIYVIYLLFVLNSALSYLFAYKRSLLFADQQNFKISAVTAIFKILLAAVQITGLVLTGSYYAYLISMIVLVFLENVVLSLMVDRHYPYLRKYKKAQVDDVTKKRLISDTKALMMHKVGSIAVYQTDNLITSAFVNLATVGLYSNYELIANSLRQLITSMTEGMKASIGNYNASEGPEKRLAFFKKYDLLLHLINSFCTVSMFCLFNPFIGLFFGKKYLFDMPLVLIISIAFYVRGMRVSFNTIKETCGIFRPDRYKPLFEAGGNVVLSIILVKLIGFPGVILGTIITTLLICYPIEVYVTCKYAFESGVALYYKMLLKNSVLLTLQLALTYGLCLLLPGDGFLNLLLRAVVCLILPNALNLLFYWRTEEMRYFWRLGGAMLCKLPFMKNRPHTNG